MVEKRDRNGVEWNQMECSRLAQATPTIIVKQDKLSLNDYFEVLLVMKCKNWYSKYS
jgi:hypothetical protein